MWLIMKQKRPKILQRNNIISKLSQEPFKYETTLLDFLVFV